MNREERRSVLDHLQHCDACRDYYDDMRALHICLQESDREPPLGYEQRWKSRLQEAQKSNRIRKVRWGALVPIVTGCAAAVFTISTLIVNPQAFGLEGNRVQSEWFAASQTSASQIGSQNLDPGVGQRVSFVGTSEKKPNLLDFESSDYSEITTQSSAAPQLETTGTIEPAPNDILSSIEAALTEAGGQKSQEDVLTIELATSEERRQIADRAVEKGCSIVSEDEAAIVIEGTPAQIIDLMDGHHLDIPDDVALVRVQFI